MLGRVVRYVGRIDDQYGVGFQRPSPTRRDLSAALDELLAGREVSQPMTDAPGCLIGRVAKTEPQGTVTYSEQIREIVERSLCPLPPCWRHRPLSVDQL